MAGIQLELSFFLHQTLHRSVKNQSWGGDPLEADEEDEEIPRTKHRRYMESDQNEVSDGDHWAELNHGHMPWDDYDRMLAFSRANQIRLQRVADSLLQRRREAEIAGNWGAASNYARAIAEIESLRDIA